MFETAGCPIWRLRRRSVKRGAVRIDRSSALSSHWKTPKSEQSEKWSDEEKTEETTKTRVADKDCQTTDGRTKERRREKRIGFPWVGANQVTGSDGCLAQVERRRQRRTSQCIQSPFNEDADIGFGSRSSFSVSSELDQRRARARFNDPARISHVSPFLDPLSAVSSNSPVLSVSLTSSNQSDHFARFISLPSSHPAFFFFYFHSLRLVVDTHFGYLCYSSGSGSHQPFNNADGSRATR